VALNTINVSLVIICLVLVRVSALLVQEYKGEGVGEEEENSGEKKWRSGGEGEKGTLNSLRPPPPPPLYTPAMQAKFCNMY